jgi:hypothetical protein
MLLRRVLGILVAVGFSGAAVLAQAADPMIGTWKLNVAKSKTTYKSGTTVIEAAGPALKATVDLVGADGTAYHWTWTAAYDGKDVPVIGNTPFGTGTASLTKVDAHTVKIVGKVNGKIVVNQTVTTSADGKSRTVVSKGTDAKGQPIESTSIYDKQ